MLAGNLMMASGLSRIGEVFNRIVSGEAKRGVAHATSGPCLQHNLVAVWKERRKHNGEPGSSGRHRPDQVHHQA